MDGGHPRTRRQTRRSVDDLSDHREVPVEALDRRRRPGLFHAERVLLDHSQASRAGFEGRDEQQVIIDLDRSADVLGVVIADGVPPEKLPAARIGSGDLGLHERHELILTADAHDGGRGVAGREVQTLPDDVAVRLVEGDGALPGAADQRDDRVAVLDRTGGIAQLDHGAARIRPEVA